MKFAAGLTVTGIISFLLIEALKILLPSLTAWLVGVLLVVLKIALVVLGLVVALGAVGVGAYVYKRTRRAREAP
ncbi:MAG: hypothetical protein P8170_09775 [Gemmatimonadota bacterium]|jgi:ABC-type uncharacterized transport system permease subunit